MRDQLGRLLPRDLHSFILTSTAFLFLSHLNDGHQIIDYKTHIQYFKRAGYPVHSRLRSIKSGEFRLINFVSHFIRVQIFQIDFPLILSASTCFRWIDSSYKRSASNDPLQIFIHLPVFWTNFLHKCKIFLC